MEHQNCLCCGKAQEWAVCDVCFSDMMLDYQYHDLPDTDIEKMMAQYPDGD
jgi:hypothetical protein